jgi:hypothetical protein
LTRKVSAWSPKFELFSLVHELNRFPDRAVELGARAKHAAETLGGALAATTKIAEDLLQPHART